MLNPIRDYKLARQMEELIKRCLNTGEQHGRILDGKCIFVDCEYEEHECKHKEFCVMGKCKV